MTVLHILVAMPCAKICSGIDGTIKLILFSWLFKKNNVKSYNKEIKKRFLVLFASNLLKSVLAKPFHIWCFKVPDYWKVVSFLLLKNILINVILISVLYPEKELWKNIICERGCSLLWEETKKVCISLELLIPKMA